MVAPALIMLARGSTDPGVAEVTYHLRFGLQSMRPEVEAHAAFLDIGSPTPDQVLGHLANRGATESVLVPLHLSSMVDHDPVVNAAINDLRLAHPQVRLAVARPLGPEAPLLKPLDERLRGALGSAHATELDGLVLSAEGPADVRGTTVLARRARQWGAHHKLPCVLAMSDGAGMSVGAAIESLNDQGRRHVAVGSFFLAASPAFEAQAHLALRHGAVAVSAPIGVDDTVLDLILARYAFAAMDLLDNLDDFSYDDLAEVSG